MQIGYLSHASVKPASLMIPEIKGTYVIKYHAIYLCVEVKRTSLCIFFSGDWLQKYFARAFGISNEPKPECLLEEVTFEGIAKYIASEKCQKIVTMAGAGISTCEYISLRHNLPCVPFIHRHTCLTYSTDKDQIG